MDKQTELELYKKLSNIKVGMINTSSVFITSIALSLRYIFSEDTLTMDVDGTTVRINPDFFNMYTPKEILFVLLHAAWHVALDHINRGEHLDSEIFNKAADYVINLMLVNTESKNYTMPKIGLLDYKYKDMSTLAVYNDLIKNKDSTPQKPNPMAGDIVTPPKEKAKEVQAKVKELISRAAITSKMANESYGDMPEELKLYIGELINPKLPWNVLLQNFLTEKIKNDYSYSRPNKRFMPDFIMPSQYSEGLSHITIAIDTSGSMTQDDLIAILTEIESIRDNFNPETITILDCDTSIHNEHQVTPDMDILGLQFNGGGGTNFTPVIDYCNTHDTNVLLYFTDLWATQIEEEQTYPIIWLCYSDHTEAPIGETIYYNM